MDVALAFLPWKFIWDLQMSKKEKIGVVVAMSMGVLFVSLPVNLAEDANMQPVTVPVLLPH